MKNSQNILDLVFTSLIFLFIGFLLLYKLGSYPNILYNWENFPVWNIFQFIFNEDGKDLLYYTSISDGLMTDTGFSLIIGLPMMIITKFFGLTLLNLRIWPVILSFLSLVVFYIFIKKFYSKNIARVSVLLFGLSQGFLFYGRSAINVAPTILPEIITVSLIYCFLKKPNSVIIALLSLAIILINNYFYAPIRFFTPILLLIFIFYFLIKIINFLTLSINNRLALKLINISLVVFTLISIASLSYFNFDAVLNYYNARGEHVVASIKSQQYSQPVFQETIDLIKNNSMEFVNLIFALETRPVITDSHNHYGQLINKWLVPFFILGVLLSIFKLFKNRDFKYFGLVIWYLFSSLPIILTSNVHIGRVFLATPPMYILTSIGLIFFVDLVIIKVRKIKLKYAPLAHNVSYTVLAVFIFITLSKEISDYFDSSAITNHNVNIIKENRQKYLNSKRLYVINADDLSLHFWEMVYYLKQDFVFIDSKSQKQLDINRSSIQTGVGILVRSPDEYHKILTPCLNPDFSIVIIGKKPISFITENPSCKANITLLYQ